MLFSKGWVVFNENVALSTQRDGDVDGALAATMRVVFVDVSIVTSAATEFAGLEWHIKEDANSRCTKRDYPFASLVLAINTKFISQFSVFLQGFRISLIFVFDRVFQPFDFALGHFARTLRHSAPSPIKTEARF
jgi:hypothetical protein